MSFKRLLAFTVCCKFLLETIISGMLLGRLCSLSTELAGETSLNYTRSGTRMVTVVFFTFNEYFKSTFYLCIFKVSASIEFKVNFQEPRLKCNWKPLESLCFMQLETPTPCSHKALVSYGLNFNIWWSTNATNEEKANRIFSVRESKINFIISQKFHTSHNENFLLQPSVRSSWGDSLQCSWDDS